MKVKMKLPFIFSLVLVIGFQNAAAQFNIKIPKINKPKTEQTNQTPNTNSPTPDNEKSKETNPTQKTSRQGDFLTKPQPTNTPQFMLNTLEVKAHNEQRYWKAPTQSDYSCWYPQVSFDVFYDDQAPKLRFTAEWFNPDGSSWFSEPLEKGTGDFVNLRSPYESKDLDQRAVVSTGTYSLKITDSKTSQVIFQGKFKINKLPLDPKLKNKNLFYVDNDWNLPIGYVGFKKDFTDYEIHTRPIAFFWFKGVLESSQFEGELYYNNQRIATTAKGGNVNSYAERGEDCFLARDTCAQRLWGFEWENFVLENSPSARQNNPNGWFTKDHPGEYTVKVFYKGDQVREAKFNIDAKGWVARNAFSDQMFITDYQVPVPVKILGTLDKWNQTSWKTDAFYGNPLNGFNIP